MNLLHLILNIIVFPFVLLRMIFLFLALWCAKHLPVISIIPYIFLWLNNIIILVLSIGHINNLEVDGYTYRRVFEENVNK